MRYRVGTTLGAMVLLWASSASAQVAWDSPMLTPPTASSGFGVYLVDTDGGNLGVLTSWRAPGAAGGLELRFGLADRQQRPWETNASALSGLFGVSLSGVMTRATPDMPLDISWVAGAGVGVGSWVWASFPVGISAGHTFTSEGMAFTPYVSPRIVFDATFGRRDDLFEPDNETALGLAVDLGVDMSLGWAWSIRFGGTFGSREALAIGLVF